MLYDRTLTVELSGGLGNQLFQLVAAAAVAMENEIDLRVDYSRVNHGVTVRPSDLRNYRIRFQGSDLVVSGYSSNLPRIYDVACHRIRMIRMIDARMRNVFVSETTGWDSGIFAIRSKSRIRGYFQSYEYLSLLEKAGVFLDIQISSPTENFIIFLDKISQTNPTGIHVRRGDYRRFGDTIGLLGPNYYVQAIKSLGLSVNDDNIYIFSEVSKDLEDEFRPIFRNAKFVSEKELSDPMESLLLMSKFKNLIISNSTFSWWSAALSSETTNILCPRDWFRNLQQPVSLKKPNWTEIDSVWMD